MSAVCGERAARRSRAAAAALVAVGLVLTGCASLPVSGPVREGVGDGLSMRRDVVVDPVGPLAGAGPRSQVRSFLSAAVGVADNFDVARSYLTEGSAAAWRPSKELYVVRLTGRTIVLSQAGAVLDERADQGIDPGRGPVTATVSAVAVAAVDTHGVYTAQPPGEVVSEALTLVREGGQWRISETPDQIFVVESDFDLGWEPRSLWFPDPSGQTLVPEVRWFADREALPTAVVTELLRGPSPWLAPAVRRRVVPQPELSSASVVVDRGTAEVDLERGVLDSDLASLGLLVASIETTLTSLPRVSGVIVTAGGGRISAATPAAPPTSDVPVGTSAVLLSDEGQPIRWSSFSVSPVPGIPGGSRGLSAPVTAGPEPAVAADPEPALAALSDAGTALVRWPAGTGERAPQTLLSVTSPTRLTPPSFDPFGWLWSTPTVSDGTVTAVGGADGEPVSVAAPWLEGRRLVSLRVSREGARALVASAGDEAGGVRVDVVGVRRSAAGVPAELVAGERVPSVTLASVEDAAWTGASTAAVLGVALSQPGDSPPVRQVFGLAGGSLEPLGAPGVPPGPGQPDVPTLVSLAGGDGERSLLLGTADRRVFQRAGARWVQVPSLDGAVEPAYPG